MDDLFVIDASIFPTASGANPMVTTLAIAHLLSTRLATRLVGDEADAREAYGGEAQLAVRRRHDLSLRREEKYIWLALILVLVIACNQFARRIARTDSNPLLGLRGSARPLRDRRSSERPLRDHRTQDDRCVIASRVSRLHPAADLGACGRHSRAGRVRLLGHHPQARGAPLHSDDLHSDDPAPPPQPCQVGKEGSHSARTPHYICLFLLCRAHCAWYSWDVPFTFSKQWELRWPTWAT